MRKMDWKMGLSRRLTGRSSPGGAVLFELRSVFQVLREYTRSADSVRDFWGSKFLPVVSLLSPLSFQPNKKGVLQIKTSMLNFTCLIFEMRPGMNQAEPFALRSDSTIFTNFKSPLSWLQTINPKHLGSIQYSKSKYGHSKLDIKLNFCSGESKRDVSSFANV